MAGMILRTAAEAFAVLALIIGFIKENEFIKVERKAFRFLRFLRRKARDARKQERARERQIALYAGEYATRRRSRPAVRSSADDTKRKSARGRVA